MVGYKKQTDTRVADRTSSLCLTLTISDNMENWNRISSSISSLNIGQSASKLAKGFNSNVQAARERLGQVSQEELTELPPGCHLHIQPLGSVDHVLIDACPCRV